MPNNTIRFTDFFAFLVAACFVSGVSVAPYVTAWHYMDKHFSRMAEHDSRPLAEGSWGLALPGAPNAPSRPRIAGPHTEGKGGAMPPSSDPQDSSRSGLFALTHRGDPRWEMGRGGASLEGLQALANGAASLCGIDPALFWSLILRESSGRHWDAQGSVLRSSSNALGLGQIKASTARDVSPLLDPMDPWQNSVASACYLRQQFDRFGTWRKALHAYHRGPNAAGKTPIASREYASDILTGSAQ